MNAWLTTFAGFSPSIVDAPGWVVLLLKITMILTAAWLVHLALLAANPRWRVLLWRVTAVGLICLPTLSWLLPAINIRLEQAAPVNVAMGIPTPAPVRVADRDIAVSAPGGFAGDLPDRAALHRFPTRPNAPADDVGASPLPQPRGNVPASEKPSRITPSQVLLAVWLVGIATLACRLCVGYYRIHRLARCFIQPPQWVRSECLRVAQAIGCRGCVEVVQSAAVQSPLLYCLRRQRLLLPAAMCDDAYRGDLPAIFAHELAHVRSRDLPWNFGLHLISVALWFHPLVWRMRRAHLAACELVSDAVSASFVGDVSGYCRTLARVAVHAYASIPATGIAMARRSSISRRLSALKRKVFSLPLRRRSMIAFGLVALLTVALLGVLQFALAAPPATEPAAQPATAGKGETKTVAKEAEPAKNRAVPAKSGVAGPKTGSLRVLVLDPQGKSLADANIHAGVWTEEKGFKANHNYKTDSAGITCVELPKTFFILRLWARKEPLVAMFADWEQNELASGKGVPEEYTFRLESGVTAGGRILDEHGKPIAGAKVQVMLSGNPKPAKADRHTGYDIWLASGSDAATTNADGRWRIENVPNRSEAALTLKVFHPDFASDDNWGGIQKEAGITMKMLRDETAKLTLKRGIILRGQVTDPAGKPIKHALVVRGDDPYMFSTGNGVPCVFPTDADGRFRLPAQPPGEKVLTVITPGWAPQLRHVNLQSGLPSQDFRMAPGKPIQLRIVDAAGKPIPRIYVNIEGWRGGKSLYNIRHPNILDSKIPGQADKNGIWEWTWAPDDPVKLNIYPYAMKGFAPCELEIAGGAPPRTVTLKAEHLITGRVTDAVTGKPIPAFTVIPINVFRKDWLSAERMNAVVGKNGRLNYLATRTDVALRLRIEAAGYRTQTGPEFRMGDDTSRTQDFQLQPSPPVTGVVLDAAGQPVAKAEVLLATPTEWPKLDESINNHVATADAAGRFNFPDPGEPFIAVARADAGFAQAEFPAGRHDTGVLRLQPWAAVRGLFRDGGRPVRGALMLLQPVRADTLDRPRVDAIQQTRTDVNGRFEFKQVPPLPGSVRVHLGPWQDEGFRSGPSVPLDLQPGQRAELDLGGAGTVVKGKVTLTGKFPADLDCTYSLNYLVSRTPGIAPPPEIAVAGLDIRNGWKAAWSRTTEDGAYLSTLQHWFVKLAPDGTFRVSGVPPGEYDLAIEIYAKPSGCLVDPLAQKVVRVTVTAADAARGELTLPEIPAEVVPIPAIGDTPALTFHRADGADGSLTDFRGRYTLLHFWASWCGPCKQQLPALRRLHEQFAARGLAALGLSLDDDPAAWEAALKRLDLPWPQGRIAASGGAGVSSVPAYWLLDPAGKIVAKVYDLDELAKSLAERLK